MKNHPLVQDGDKYYMTAYFVSPGKHHCQAYFSSWIFFNLIFFHKNLWNSIFLICLQILFALMDERLVSSTARVLGQTCIFKTALIQWPPSGFLTKSQPLVQQRGSKVTVSLPWVSASHLFLFNISIFYLWVRYIPFVNIVALTNRDNVISVKVTML